MDRARVARDGIDCDFRRRTSYAYVGRRDRGRLEDEAQAAAERRAAGDRSSTTTPLPFDVAGAVRFDDQAEFHAQQVPARRWPRSCPRSTSTRTPSRSATFVRTPGGPDRRRAHRSSRPTSRSRTARSRSPARTRSAPTRSPAGSPGEPPDGMFISGGSPTRSIRAIPVGGAELLLVGGEGHRTGTGGDTEQRYAALEAFAREHWDVRVGRVPLVGAGQHDGRRPAVRRPADAVRGPRADGHRLRQVGPDRRHRGRAAPRRPRARPREPVRVAVRPDPAQRARLAPPSS